MRVVHVILAVTLGLSLTAVPTAAQQQRRGIWQDEAVGVQELIDELRPLIERNRRARAADPRFLEDLEAVLGRYDSPWQVTLLADDFGDGDYTRYPSWTVNSGEFSIHRRRGLLSRVDPAEISTRLDITNAFSIRLRLTSLGNQGRLLFGPYQAGEGRAGYRLAYNPGGRPSLELLRVGRRKSPPPTPKSTSTTIRKTSAQLKAAVVKLNRMKAQYAEYQRTGTTPRNMQLGKDLLVKYKADVARIRAELAKARKGSRSTSNGRPGRRIRIVIESHDQPVELQDGRPHLLEWNRTSDGTMTVSIDSRELMRVQDRRFRGPFDGFTLINRGGDYAVRWIRIKGMP